MGRHQSGDSLNTTARLFISAKLGKKEEIELLVGRVHQRLFRFCLFLTGNIQEARDLSQEAYVKLLEKKDTLEEPKYFLSWLFQITKNLFLNHLRSPKNRPYQDIEEIPALISDGGKRENDFALIEALSGLAPEDRLLVLIVHLEGCSYEEAAEALGLSLSLVKGRLHRARICMQNTLSTKTRQFAKAG